MPKRTPWIGIGLTIPVLCLWAVLTFGARPLAPVIAGWAASVERASGWDVAPEPSEDDE